jgi:hypothetical protein
MGHLALFVQKIGFGLSTPAEGPLCPKERFVAGTLQQGRAYRPGMFRSGTFQQGTTDPSVSENFYMIPPSSPGLNPN